MSRRRIAAAFFAVLTTPLAALHAQEPAAVELVRDRYGVPHVFATSDADAMFGLGWAAAEDRAFQMYLGLRTVQGRLAELVGDLQQRNRRDTAIDHDMKLRTFGFWRHAQEVAENLDGETRALLDAYCAGVDASIAAHREQLSPLFERYGLEPEPWTPAACLASWWRVAAFFGTDGTRDLIAWRNRDDPRRTPPAPVAPDDDAAVVQPTDVDDAWIREVAEFAKRHGLARDAAPAGEGRKFSHAWVVGGTRTTTGAAILCSDPQTPVTNPSLFWEFHVAGATFDARGIGVPGSPILLIGFNARVAWGVTALGADQADLFRLETDPEQPDRYRFDGEWREMTTRTETIAVAGGRAREIEVRETHLGPVVTRFAFAQRGEPEVALHRVPLCDEGVASVQASFAMMRARDVDEFWRSLAGWRFPSMNVVFGDRDGGIGYSVAGAFPMRSPDAIRGGGMAHDGTASTHAWQGFVPFELLPHVLRPERGFLLSANHRPIASFYPLDLGNTTGSLGDTLRSLRLRELLSAKSALAPQDVLAIHQDTVDPARREVVRLGVHLRDAQHATLSEAARDALEVLEPWLRDGARSDLRRPGAGLAEQLAFPFRQRGTPLALVHGGGLSGLSRLLKTLRARHDLDPAAPLDDLERAWVDGVLAGAWRTASERFGTDPATWDAAARRAVQRERMGYYAGLDGFPSLSPDHDIAVPALWCVDGNTIQSQRAQSYTQLVPLDDVDSALTILPIGTSELPDDAHRLSELERWAAGELHPAPLTREAVEKIAASRQTIRR